MPAALYLAGYYCVFVWFGPIFDINPQAAAAAPHFLPTFLTPQRNSPPIFQTIPIRIALSRRGPQIKRTKNLIQFNKRICCVPWLQRHIHGPPCEYMCEYLCE